MTELISVIRAVEAVKATQQNESTEIDPMGSNSIWIYDALAYSQYTCSECASLDGARFRGSEIASQFPFHIVASSTEVYPMTHPNCRCRLLLIEVVET